MSAPSSRYVLGNRFFDGLMAVMWAYLVFRGFGRRRGLPVR
jgi:hypothetical protein